MATKVELPKALVQQAIQLKIGSLQRAAKSEFNPAIRQLQEKDIAEYQVALNTLTEVK